MVITNLDLILIFFRVFPIGVVVNICELFALFLWMLMVYNVSGFAGRNLTTLALILQFVSLNLMIPVFITQFVGMNLPTFESINHFVNMNLAIFASINHALN